MKAKTIVKLAVDFLMTIFLLLLMGYQFWGETAHEWVGAGMFLLFIAHHILNGSWYKNLFKGRYSAVRILTLCLDALLLIAMLAQMYSGIVMSRYVFDFLPVSGGMLLARRLHILGSYWGFLLMSLHLGLHWNMILGMLRKATQIKRDSKVRRAVVRAAGGLVAGYGCYVFIKREFPTYLLLKEYGIVFFHIRKHFCNFRPRIGIVHLQRAAAFFICPVQVGSAVGNRRFYFK